MLSTGASTSGVAAADLDRAWRVAQPLTPVGYYPRFGPLPAVVAVHDQTGAWDAPDQTRVLELSDGGSVIEHTRIVDAPHFFAYELTDFQKLFGRLVEGARAEWTWTPVEGGTRIDWTYEFHPKPRCRAVVATIVRLFWGPYMRRVLPGILRAVEWSS
jgi:hypothetical protein